MKSHVQSLLNLVKLPVKCILRSSLFNKVAGYQSVALLGNKISAKVNFVTKFCYKKLKKNFSSI